MKKMFILLLTMCSAFISASAAADDNGEWHGAVKVTDDSPNNIIVLFANIGAEYGQKDTETAFFQRNLDTGIIEASVSSIKFVCSTLTDKLTQQVADAFSKDAHCGYKVVHEIPGEGNKWQTSVEGRDYTLRNSSAEEMWLLCVKNKENPRLRDLYCISWSKQKGTIQGTIYNITSLRPDLAPKYDKNKSKRFTINVTVDNEILDSLYNIYIAPWGNSVSDNNLVATVPVVNKHAQFSMELDDAVEGRLRCIFPNGELCSAWMDMKFIPGMTLNITVHNGHFDIENESDYNSQVANIRFSKQMGNFAQVARDNLSSVMNKMAVELSDKMDAGRLNGNADIEVEEISRMEKLREEAQSQSGFLEYINEQIKELLERRDRDEREVKKNLKQLYKNARKINDRIMEINSEMMKEMRK